MGYHDGILYKFGPTTGATIRTVATGLPDATGLATDPLTGDLFVSEIEGGPIMRVSPTTGAKSVYANVMYVDGLTFDPRDGTLYGAHLGTDIVVVDRAGGTTFISPGSAATTLDGIALAATTVPGQPPFLFVNQNNGTIHKVDLTTMPLTVTAVTTGGSRGTSRPWGPTAAITRPRRRL